MSSLVMAERQQQVVEGYHFWPQMIVMFAHGLCYVIGDSELLITLCHLSRGQKEGLCPLWNPPVPTTQKPESQDQERAQRKPT